MNRQQMINHFVLNGWESVCAPLMGWGIAKTATAEVCMLTTYGRAVNNLPWTRCSWDCLTDAELAQLLDWLENVP